MLLSADLCFELIYTKIKFCNFADKLKDKFLSETTILSHEIEKKNLSVDNKRHLFYIHRFIKKSSLFIKELSLLDKGYIEIESVMSKFIQANYEFTITELECKEIFQNYFIINEEKETIFTDSITGFLKNNYTFKIKLTSFVEIIIKELIQVFSKIENKLGKLFEMNDTSTQGILHLKQFEALIKQLNSNVDYRKVYDYFK